MEVRMPVTSPAHPGLVYGLFADLHAKFKLLETWNADFGLGHSRETLRELKRKALHLAGDRSWGMNYDRMFTDILPVPFLDDTTRTMQFLLDRVHETYHRFTTWERFEHLSDGAFVNLIPEAKDFKNCIKLIVVDLGAEFNEPILTSPIDAHTADASHASILASLAYSPVFGRQMNGMSVPHLWLPGYEMRVPEYSKEPLTPAVSWFDKGLVLSACPSRKVMHGHSMPRDLVVC